MLERIAFTAVLALAVGAAHAEPAAPAAPPPPCTDAEYRQMDFWVGDWELDIDAGGGKVTHASNHITKDEFGGCVVAEHFEQPDTGYKGASWSMYDGLTGQWRQTWVDNSGGVFVLVGGPAAGQPYAFELKTVDVRGPTKAAQAFKRMIWQDVTPDSLTWRWQSLAPDGSWTDQWVLKYRRKSSPTG